MRILNETSFPRPLLRYSTDMDNTLASFPFHLLDHGDCVIDVAEPF